MTGERSKVPFSIKSISRDPVGSKLLLPVIDNSFWALHIVKHDKYANNKVNKFFFIIKIEKAQTIRCLFSYLAPPSNHATKQARTVHALSGANLLDYLLSVANFGGFDMRETRAESSSI